MIDNVEEELKSNMLISNILIYEMRVEAEIKSQNYTEALKVNDIAYELLFKLYKSSEIRVIKKKYSEELEVIAEKGRFIQEKLLGEKA